MPNSLCWLLPPLIPMTVPRRPSGTEKLSLTLTTRSNRWYSASGSGMTPNCCSRGCTNTHAHTFTYVSKMWTFHRVLLLLYTASYKYYNLYFNEMCLIYFTYIIHVYRHYIQWHTYPKKQVGLHSDPHFLVHLLCLSTREINTST